MIPRLGPTTGYLPKGEHRATWEEFEAAFNFSPKRKQLLVGLLEGARQLHGAGVRELYVDGSFVTKRHLPGDFDCCYYNEDVDYDDIDPVFADFSDDRKAMKDKFGGEFFPASFIASRLTGEPYRSFFQRDKNGRAKGIIVLDLDTLP